MPEAAVGNVEIIVVIEGHGGGQGKSGGDDHPMEQLRKAGVDLSDPGAFQAVIDNLDRLVTRLEEVMEQMEG